ncbi:MAG: hypothetical protein IKO75_06595 [Bacteroidales bacterium]|nr:hypothetical protein [Bacteroidales bacterium]
MKKYLIPLLLVAFLVTAFTSCKPDEEIYDPTCKISKIWYRSDVGSPNEVFVYDSKDKQLQQIVVDSLYSFDFSYNKDKTVSKIVHVGKDYTETVDFQWTDQLVDKMTYTIDGAVRLEYTFHRNNNKKDKAFGRIDSIQETYDRVFYDEYFWKSKRHPLYDKVFGNYEEISEIAAKANTKDLVMYSVKYFTYDPGKKEKYENISKYVEVFPIAQTVVTHTYQYDLNSYNPFYGLPFAYADMAGYYLNLKTAEHIETEVAGNLSKVEDIIYKYDGLHYMNDKGYPRQFVTVSSINNIPVHTYILYKK